MTPGRRAFQVVGTAGAKAPRREHTWNVPGAAESTEAREWLEEGKCAEG